MEWVNQEIEAYLCVFVSHHQDDWADWLPLAKFAYNNCVHSTTCCTPFKLDSGQHPWMGSVSQLATGCVTCHTSHGCMTHFRPILGNLVEVTLMTSPFMYIVSHAKG